jgi:hypothetical protein
VRELTEIVDLVSEGYFYPSSSVLSSGKLHLKHMTAREEELLTNTNLLKRGELDKEFILSVIQEPINYDELLYCDRNSIILNSKLLNYGSVGKLNLDCDGCEQKFDQEISFGFRSNPFDFSACERGKNLLPFILPSCKKTIWFKLPTTAEYAVYSRFGWLEFLKTITTSIDGADDVERFIEDEMSAKESLLLRKHFETKTPGYNTNIQICCPTCSSVKKAKIEINPDIFGIAAESKMMIHSEIFDLCYFTNGAFTQEGVYNLPTHLRSFYIKKMIETKKNEEEARNKTETQSGPKISKPPAVKK